jgi:5-methylthioadenosine/S-adenosylhomocysteine deaminase
MVKATCIKGADWIITWDPAEQRHAYLNGGDLAFRGDRIEFVGQGYDGLADEIVDGRGLLVMPGLVDIHSHPSTEPFFRGLREEQGVPQMYMSGLYERFGAFFPEMDARRHAAAAAYCEMLLSGVTTAADLSAVYPGWIETAGQSGLRLFLAPGYSSARWQIAGEWRLEYRWDEAAGRKGFDAALSFIDEIARHPSGRLSGIVFPTQVDTCSEELLRDSAAAATERKLPFTTHCAQSVNEFNEMVSRHGKTPIQWADQIGILGANATLGHAIFIDEHSWLHWHSRDDLKILGNTGTSVAHCPTCFGRYGQTLEDVGRYRRAGVNLALGTDVSPHNLIEEMRHAIMLGRVAAEDLPGITTADLFHAATVGGAAALGRHDLGRLAPGMKADLVLVDLRNPFMMPARDPLRSLIYSAADRAVRDVYVDGTTVVDRGRVLTLDHAGALEALAEAQRRMEAAAPARDFRKRTAARITPLSLPVLEA